MEKLYEVKEVNDLVWAIKSTPLLHLQDSYCLSPIFFIQLFETHKEWFDKLDNEPSSLISFINSKGKLILGKYFETLWEFFFKNSPFYELLLYNHQIIDNKVTFGELDFLVRHIESNKIQHFEVAVKFYLNTLNKNDWKTWIGPNKKDNLDKKFNVLVNKQLKYHLHPSIQNRYPNISIESLLIFKGYFIQNRISKSFVLPKNSTEQNHNMFWIKKSEINLLPKTHNFSFSIKSNWFTWDRKSVENEIINVNQLQIECDRIDNTQSIFELDENNNLVGQLIILDKSWG